MQGKLQRNYAISIQDFGSETVKTIRPPFTVKFSIQRSFFGSANAATIQIYNLNADTRSFIRKDITDPAFIKGIVFLGGYGDQLATLLRGNINVAWSERQETDYITTIQAFDGGAAFLNSNFVNQYFKGTSQFGLLLNMAQSLQQYGVEVGAISSTFNTPTKRGNAYSGNVLAIMNELSGGGMFVDNGKVNVLRDNEFIKGDILLINSRTGLIGTPRRENNNVTFNMLFEPRLYIAQKIRIEIGNTEFDGDYIVRGISHNGTISETQGETAISSVTCTEEKGMTGVAQRG